MEIGVITFNNDINLICVKAASFPEGITDAHKKIHQIVPFTMERRYFGISKPENNEGVVYRAAAEELEIGEADNLHCEQKVIKSGNYSSVLIENYQRNLEEIGKAFRLLLEQPNLDPETFCVEWYINDKDVQCMVRLT